MPNTDDATEDENPDTVQINLQLTQAFLDDIDAAWKEQGFNSRSEFLRHAVRDAVKYPDFSREGWKQIVTSAHERRTSDEELMT